MRRTLRYQLAAPVALAPLLLTLTACDPGQAAAEVDRNRGGVYCTIMADPPRFDRDRTMVAPGRFRCDNPGVDSLELAVALQRKTGGQWVGVSSAVYDAAGRDTTRNVSEGRRTKGVRVACERGTFRTALQATTVSNGIHKTYRLNSVSSRNPCSGLF